MIFVPSLNSCQISIFWKLDATFDAVLKQATVYALKQQETHAEVRMMESKRCENLLLFSPEIKTKTNKRSVDVLTTIKEVLLCCFKFFVCF